MQSIGINELYIKRINSIMYRFIWSQKQSNNKRVTEKVKRENVCKSNEAGGLDMIDLSKMQDSFYLSWADRLLNDKEMSWKTIPVLVFNRVGGLSVFNSSVSINDFKGAYLIKSSFWKKVLFCWLRLNDTASGDFSVNASDPIFNNTHVRFKNKPIFIEGCIKLSMIFIRDFMVNGQIISFIDFRSKYGNHGDTLFAYNIIFNALQKLVDEIRKSVNLAQNYNTITQYRFRGIPIGKLNRKTYYKEISNDKLILPITMSLRMQFDIDESNSEVWLMSRKCVSEVKLIQLQWKILHNIYPSGTLLYKMKIRDNENCLICGEKDTPSHCFVFCKIAKELWKEAENVIFKLTNEIITL